MNEDARVGGSACSDDEHLLKSRPRHGAHTYTKKLAHLHLPVKAGVTSSTFQHRFGDYHLPTGVLYPLLLGLTPLSSIPTDLGISGRLDHQPFGSFFGVTNTMENLYFCGMSTEFLHFLKLACVLEEKHRNDQNEEYWAGFCKGPGLDQQHY